MTGDPRFWPLLLSVFVTGMYFGMAVAYNDVHHERFVAYGVLAFVFLLLSATIVFVP